MDTGRRLHCLHWPLCFPLPGDQQVTWPVVACSGHTVTVWHKVSVLSTVSCLLSALLSGDPISIPGQCSLYCPLSALMSGLWSDLPRAPNLKELGGQGVTARRAEGVGDTGHEGQDILMEYFRGKFVYPRKRSYKTARTKRDGNATAFFSLS